MTGGREVVFALLCRDVLYGVSSAPMVLSCLLDQILKPLTNVDKND